MATVFCPKCGTKLFDCFDKAQNNLSIKCRKCRILITRCSDGTIKTGKVPERTTASGCRFY